MTETNRQLMHPLLTLMRKVSKRYDNACARAGNLFDLTISEVHVLLFLANNKNMNTAMDIVHHRGISKSLVSKSIESLVSKGYLETQQDKADRRYARLFLLPEAGSAVEALQVTQSTYIDALFGVLTHDERLEFIRMSQKMSDGIGK